MFSPGGNRNLRRQANVLTNLQRCASEKKSNQKLTVLQMTQILYD